MFGKSSPVSIYIDQYCDAWRWFEGRRPFTSCQAMAWGNLFKSSTNGISGIIFITAQEVGISPPAGTLPSQMKVAELYASRFNISITLANTAFYKPISCPILREALFFPIVFASLCLLWVHQPFSSPWLSYPFPLIPEKEWVFVSLVWNNVSSVANPKPLLPS